MKKYLMILGLFTLIGLNSNAQTIFERVYGENNSDEGSGAIQYTNGYFVLGNINSTSTSYDGCLIRTDILGNQKWLLKFGGTATDMLQHAEKTNDNNLILCGHTASLGLGSDDAWIIKTDSIGNILWQKVYGGSQSDKLYCIKEMLDSGFIAVGETKSFGPNTPSNPNMYLIRTDKNGDTLWTKSLDYGGAFQDIARYVTILSSGEFVITGNSSRWVSTNLRIDLRLSKFDNSGNSLWSSTYYTTLPGDYTYGYSVKQTLDSGFVVAGYLSGSGWYYGVILKTNNMGSYQWYQQITGSSFGDDAIVKDVDITSDSGFVVTGYIYQTWSLPGQPLAIWKYNQTGTLLWNRIYGGSQVYDEGNFISTQADNGFIIAGHTKSKNLYGQYDIYFIKTDSLGYAGLQIWTSPDTTICSSDTAHLFVNANHSHSGVTYSWTPVTTLVNPTSFNPDAYPVSTQIYYVTVTSGSEMATDSVWVNVVPLPSIPTIIANGTTLTSSSATNNQWYLNGNPISTATSQFYTVTQNGFYSVCVTDANNCSSCSTPYNFTTVGIEVNSLGHNVFYIYPNPFTSVTVFRTEIFLKDATLTIYNSVGQAVKQIDNLAGKSIIFHRDNLPSGLYFVRLTQDKKIIATDKLIITD